MRLISALDYWFGCDYDYDYEDEREHEFVRAGLHIPRAHCANMSETMKRAGIT